MKIGVLALQGDFAEHLKMLETVGVEGVRVRLPEDLEGINGLIIPGGESTTLGTLGVRYRLLDAIKGKAEEGLPIFGTCAGAILMATTVVDSDQPRLGLLDIVVNRNAYGRQKDSFEAPVMIRPIGPPPITAVFIRAPVIQSVGADVEVLATLDDQPVLVKKGGLLAATFHPELTDDNRVHRFFVDLCQ
ncbi:MAG: pyridoxal 5'-phosphate synthase glutaminase subunit PdxT [Armatimonadetes bacterium]|nr:pyridoxal 5'-phosphate synthase glutaminase subunit PdxT [Armatimonadota bacterium]MDW8121993.1 pyridoxal 5'-phosphate synthase glutaminase subunit PdxT [Armatimonadota bacterium]